jgi:phosphoribosylaminoimidazole carboxylase PurE protein
MFDIHKEEGMMKGGSMPKTRKRSPHPLVGIVMGSASDAPHMAPARDLLNSFGVPCEFLVVSAHRTPDRMFRYAEEAAARGIHVIIAGAGGAAHLPGMIAAKTLLPVIGVPVRTRGLKGLDSLLSIVQMPAGVPVAAVAIDGALNAGLLAARILATHDPGLTRHLERYRNGQRRKALGTRL